MTLLEVSGMDLHFNTKDVIYIVSFVVTGLSAWFKMKMDKQNMENEIAILEKEMLKAGEQFNNEVLSAKNGRTATKRELKEELEKSDKTLHLRIDRAVDNNLKSYEKLEDKIELLNQKYDSTTREILLAIQGNR